MNDKVRANPKAGTRVLAVANQKGGVGKTTTAVNLATAMAACDMKVLLIDLDPQGNASTGLGIPRDARVGYLRCFKWRVQFIGSYNAMRSAGFGYCFKLRKFIWRRVKLVSAEKREYRLREALVEHAETEREIFDFVLIDCPPSLGLLTLNSLVASDAVLVPPMQVYALEGLSMLLNTIERVRRVFNPSLEIQGLF